MSEMRNRNGVHKQPDLVVDIGKKRDAIQVLDVLDNLNAAALDAYVCAKRSEEKARDDYAEAKAMEAAAKIQWEKAKSELNSAKEAFIAT